MKISIIGAAGVVGSGTAFILAERGLADELILISRNHNLAANHAMDIQAAVTGRKELIVKAGEYRDLKGSDILIITAGVHFPAAAPVQQKLGSNIPIIREITKNIEIFCPEAVLINAVNPVDHLNYAIHLCSSIDTTRIIGINLNDTLRFIMAAARALNISSDRVEGVVLGEHPANPIPIFSSIKVDGHPAALSETQKVQIRDNLKNYLSSLEALKAGRSAGWTTASGLAVIVQTMVDDSRKILPCSVIPHGEYGLKEISIGLPAIIGRKGIIDIAELKLDNTEKIELKKAASKLQIDMEFVKQLIV